jgi:hypothetical protein
VSIHALARILPKLGGGTAAGAQGDARGHARGAAAPNRAEGARRRVERNYANVRRRQTGRAAAPTVVATA